MTLRFALNEQVEIHVHKRKLYESVAIKRRQIRHPAKSDFLLYRLFPVDYCLKGKDHSLMP